MVEAPSCIGKIVWITVYVSNSVFCNHRDTVLYWRNDLITVCLCKWHLLLSQNLCVNGREFYRRAPQAKKSTFKAFSFWKSTLKLYKNMSFFDSPPQAPIFFQGFPPQDLRGWGGKLFFPPRIRTPGGETKKVFPHHVGGKINTPGLPQQILLLVSSAGPFRWLFLS